MIYDRLKASLQVIPFESRSQMDQTLDKLEAVLFKDGKI